MESRRFSWPILVLLALLVPACVSRSAKVPSSQNGKKYRLILQTQVKGLPARVIEVTEMTLTDLRMKKVSQRTTNIDGDFIVRSALGREFRFVVIGMRADATRIMIYGTDPSGDEIQARLILSELLGRLDV